MGLMDNLLLLERSILSESKLKLCHMCRGMSDVQTKHLLASSDLPKPWKSCGSCGFLFPSIFAVHVSACAVSLGGFPHHSKENSHFLCAQHTKGFVLLLQVWEFCSATTESKGFHSLCSKRKCPNTAHLLHFASGTVWAALILLCNFGVSWRTWTSTFHCDFFFFNCPWHVRVVLRAWVLCQSQPVRTAQLHSATGDCLLPWQSSTVPGFGDCLHGWGDVCCPSFPHTSQLYKLERKV